MLSARRGVRGLAAAAARKRTALRRWSNFSGSSETLAIPGRPEMISDIENTKEFDLVIIGGGATGSGAALDAAMRGLKVACFEREDFASGTSSRSTKLIWGGSRYLVQALVTLFSLDLRLIRRPRESIDAFMRDFRMVLNCHRERVFLLKQQPHLTNWLPIAVPLTSWLLWPPPFGHPAAILGPLGLFPVFFKFYDMLSGFESPPSHIMTRARVERKFPQLSIENLKYCSVFYEGQHDDARTNLTLAETAAVEGAKILNYMEVRATLPATGAAAGTNKVGGLLVRDRISGREYRVKSKVILSCCGPFANEIRNLANNTNAAPGAEPKRKQPALVKGAGGVHIVLPSYFAPRGLGMVDMSTSDGRFLFLLPWEGQVLVGTTDRKMNDINMKPVPTETEIRWLLKEASKYLNREEISVRRKDVLSAWCGIRPLVVEESLAAASADTGSEETSTVPTATVSRDHVVHTDAESGIIYVLGGKWTTYREMAEDAVDRAVEAGGLTATNCRTLSRHLVGYKGFSPILAIKLVQEYGIPVSIAEGLVRRYGGRARDVLAIAIQSQSGQAQGPLNHHRLTDLRVLVPGYTYIEAEIAYAARYEWALRAEDVLLRRTRLAFLNKTEALIALPTVLDVMQRELRWSPQRRDEEQERCLQLLRSFGGPVPLHSEDGSAAGTTRLAATADILEVLNKVVLEHGHDYITVHDLKNVGEMLSHPLTVMEIQSCLGVCDPEGTGRIQFQAFIDWYNSDHAEETYSTPNQDVLKQQ